MNPPLPREDRRRRKDPYQVLGVDRHASLEEVEETYYRLAQFWNPRYNQLPDAPERYEEIHLAGVELASRVQAREYRVSRHAWVPALIAAAVIGAAISALAVVPRHQAPAAASRGGVQAQQSANPGSSPAATSAPPTGPQTSTVLDPARLTVALEDMPEGYTLVRAGPASISGPDQPPSSWDEVFARGASGQVDYRVAESMVLVYSNAAGARAGFQAQASARRDAAQLPVSLGDESVAWIEDVPGAPGFKVVRMTWRSGNLVAYVAMVGPAQSSVQDDAFSLSRVQVERLKG
jgi:hypothetical protein